MDFCKYSNQGLHLFANKTGILVDEKINVFKKGTSALEFCFQGTKFLSTELGSESEKDV